MDRPSTTRRVRLFAAAAFPIIALLLAGTPAASAHGRSGAVASDWHARITSVEPRLDGLEWRVLDGDVRLQLTVPDGHVVTVPGDGGEPFLRFAGGKVLVNANSGTALSSGIVKGTVPSSTPSWKVVADGDTYAWHEHRLRPPGGGRFSVPLTVDGQTGRIAGVDRHMAAPPLAVWAAAIAALLAVAAAVGLRRRTGQARVACAVGAGLAMPAALAATVATTLDSPQSTLAVVAEIGAAVLVGAACVLAAVRVRDDWRAFVAVGAGAVAVFQALGLFSVFLHGVVLSVLPAPAQRILVAVALAGGVAALVLGLAQLARTPGPRTGRLA
jgi:hypothetical protein